MKEMQVKTTMEYSIQPTEKVKNVTIPCVHVGLTPGSGKHYQ